MSEKSSGKTNKRVKQDLQARRLKHKTGKQMYWLFSPFLRSFHWIMVLCVFVLFFTGLYIGDPAYGGLVGSETTYIVRSPMSMSFIRLLHFVFAFILIGSCILRIYGAIRYKGDRLLPRFHKKEYWQGLVYSTKHYLFIPQKEEKEFLRNSLARTAYFSIYIALIIVIVTGLAMFAQVRPNSLLAHIFNPVNVLLTEYGTHLVHHVVAWYFMIFVIAHIYLAFRADYLERDGEISSMISGYKFFENPPVDIHDIDPELARSIAEEKKGRGLKRDAQPSPDDELEQSKLAEVAHEH